MYKSAIMLSTALLILSNLFQFSSLNGGDLQDILKMKKVKEINMEAGKLLREKKYDEALAKTTEGLKINPDSLDVLITSGKIHFAMGNMIQAYEAFKKALKIRPDDPYARSWLSKINIRDGRLATKHFVFYKVPVRMKWVTALPLEKTYNRISEVLDTYVPKPVELWFFENEDNFFKVYGAKHLHKKGKLMGVSQYDKSRILVSSLVGKDEMLSVISHELVHFFINNKMKNSKLYGIEEGLANYIGGRRANYRALERTGLFSRKIKESVKFDEYIFFRLKGVHDYNKYSALYYEVSTALIEFIFSYAGKTVLKRYINDLMRTDTDYYRLLWASLGFKSSKAFEKKFLKFIQKNIKVRGT